MNTVDEKIYNSHIIISSEGKVEACYNKAHLFDLDIPDKVRLCESDYTVPGDAMVAPVATPVGRVGLSTVSFMCTFSITTFSPIKTEVFSIFYLFLCRVTLDHNI